MLRRPKLTDEKFVLPARFDRANTHTDAHVSRKLVLRFSPSLWNLAPANYASIEHAEFERSGLRSGGSNPHEHPSRSHKGGHHHRWAATLIRLSPKSGVEDGEKAVWPIVRRTIDRTIHPHQCPWDAGFHYKLWGDRRVVESAWAAGKGCRRCPWL